MSNDKSGFNKDRAQDAMNEILKSYSQLQGGNFGDWLKNLVEALGKIQPR